MNHTFSLLNRSSGSMTAASCILKTAEYSVARLGLLGIPPLERPFERWLQTPVARQIEFAGKPVGIGGT